MFFLVKFVLLYFVIAATLVSFSQPVENEKSISFDCKELPLRTVLKKLENMAGLNFIFQDNIIHDGIKITCSIEESSKRNLLKRIFAGTDISYKLFGDNSVVLFKSKKLIGTKYNAKVIEQWIPAADTVHFFSEPKIISESNPEYPLTAVINKIEGRVTVKVLINREGKVSKANIELSSESEILDSAALSYAWRLKFMPAKVDGNPISSWYLMTFLYSVID